LKYEIWQINKALELFVTIGGRRGNDLYRVGVTDDKVHRAAKWHRDVVELDPDDAVTIL
jgi:hypothetical protein